MCPSSPGNCYHVFATCIVQDLSPARVTVTLHVPQQTTGLSTGRGTRTWAFMVTVQAGPLGPVIINGISFSRSNDEAGGEGGKGLSAEGTGSTRRDPGQAASASHRAGGPKPGWPSRLEPERTHWSAALHSWLLEIESGIQRGCCSLPECGSEAGRVRAGGPWCTAILASRAFCRASWQDESGQEQGSVSMLPISQTRKLRWDGAELSAGTSRHCSQ